MVGGVAGSTVGQEVGGAGRTGSGSWTPPTGSDERGLVSNELQAALLAWVFATPLWLLFWVVWTGRLRWLNDDLFGPFAVSFLPALAATVTLMGLSFATGLTLLFWVAPVVLVTGTVLWFLTALRDLAWLQPAWYREQLAAGPDTRGRGAELVGGVARRPRAPAGSGEVGGKVSGGLKKLGGLFG
jgi:hypothetical protein